MIEEININEEVLDEEEVKLSLTVEDDPEEEALGKIPTIAEILEEFRKPYPKGTIITCTSFDGGGWYTLNYKYRTEIRKGWGKLEKYNDPDSALVALYADTKELIKDA